MTTTGKTATEKAARLRLAGIITGLAGLAGMITWGLYMYEGGPSLIALIPLDIFYVPFAVGIAIGWKEPFWGGAALIILALLYSAGTIGTHLTIITSQPLMEQLAYPLQMTAACFLPQLISGVLFILAGTARRQKAA
ncbi:MAG: hypothetical protein WC370_04025 [Dehalococcoidales bacterium]|jgi:hypothetical protein